MEISLLVMLCWVSVDASPEKPSMPMRAAGGGEEDCLLQNGWVAGGINDQSGGYLPLRQLIRQRLMGVIERQIGAVVPCHL